MLIAKRPDRKVLADLFGECYVYHFGVNSTGDVEIQSVTHFAKRVSSCNVSGSTSVSRN